MTTTLRPLNEEERLFVANGGNEAKARTHPGLWSFEHNPKLLASVTKWDNDGRFDFMDAVALRLDAGMDRVEAERQAFAAVKVFYGPNDPGEPPTTPAASRAASAPPAPPVTVSKPDDGIDWKVEADSIRRGKSESGLQAAAARQAERMNAPRPAAKGAPDIAGAVELLTRGRK